jgi:hypothetical protein
MTTSGTRFVLPNLLMSAEFLPSTTFPTLLRAASPFSQGGSRICADPPDCDRMASWRYGR